MNVAEKNLIICHLCDFAPPFAGNFMASLVHLEAKLKSTNVNNKVIYVFYKEANDREWARKMQNDGWDENLYFIEHKSFQSFLRLRKILKINSVGILHLHFGFPVIVLALLKIFCSNVQIIFHYRMYIKTHSSLIDRIKKTVKVFLFNNIPDTICAVSKAVFYDLIKLGVNKEKCRYIDNGIAFSRLDMEYEDGKVIYNLQDKKVIMIYGTFFYIKGVDIAISAIKDIADEYGIVLMIVCQNKDFVLEQIRKLISHIPGWIFIVPSQENIVFYYKMSDLYLTPSRGEAFSNNMLESIYCGTPVIRSDNPGMDRGLPHDIKFPINDVSSFRECIISILNKPKDEKDIILSEQKEYIVKKWNIDTWSDKIINMYFQQMQQNKNN